MTVVVVVVVVVSIIAWKMSVSAFRAASVNNGTAAAVFLTLALKGCSCRLIPVHPQYAHWHYNGKVDVTISGAFN